MIKTHNVQSMCVTFTLSEWVKILKVQALNEPQVWHFNTLNNNTPQFGVVVYVIDFLPYF